MQHTNAAEPHTRDARLATEQRLRALAARLDHLREEERGHLARELHDHFGQTLTALKLSLSSLLLIDPADRQAVERQVRRMIDMCDSIIEDVQRVSQTLRPGLLDDVGLMAAVEWEIRGFERRTGVACDTVIAGDDSVLERGQGTAIFRILQEALTNVTRHAGARHASVSLRVGPQNAVLVVRDDGRGFVVNEESRRSLGLLGMRERALAWGGAVEVYSTVGEGTCVAARFPLAPATARGDGGGQGPAARSR